MRSDDFGELARYYDPIMEHVNYDRWFRTCVALAELLPPRFLHVDAGCGTGVLLGRLREAGWKSTGVDLSRAMLMTARKQRGSVPVAVADLRALPFHRSAGLVTCLFDSINFILDEPGVARAIQEMAQALAPGGLLYFDIVTERMVTQHFAGQDWEEDNGGFSSNWSSSYDHQTTVAQTRIRINTGGESVIRERIYPQRFFERAVRHAGLRLLGAYDVEGWKAPSRHTTRIDFIAVKEPAPEATRQFKKVVRAVREQLQNV
jgi:SAM-dependent methyltransferase